MKQTEKQNANGNHKIVAGVTLAFVSEAFLKTALESVRLESRKPIEALVKDMQGYYRGNYDKEDLYVCDTCGGFCVDEDPACPFCGDDPEASPRTSAEDAEKKNTETTKKENHTMQTETTKTPSPKKPRKNAKATTALATTSTTALEGVVVNPEKGMSQYTVLDLDAGVESCRAALMTTVSAAYQFGLRCKDLYEKELWKLRTDKEGKPVYTNFKKFCAEELGVSHTWAFSAMDITGFTPEQVDAIGTSKLALVLRAPEGQREKLFEAAEKGATKEELTKKLAKLRAKANGSNGAEVEPEEDPRRKAMTLRIKPGKKTVAFMKKPEKGKEPESAKKLGDQPWLAVELGNDCSLFVRLVQKEDGTLHGVVEFKRINA